jgi:hypothetical protein
MRFLIKILLASFGMNREGNNHAGRRNQRFDPCDKQRPELLPDAEGHCTACHLGR